MVTLKKYDIEIAIKKTMWMHVGTKYGIETLNTEGMIFKK